MTSVLSTPRRTMQSMPEIVVLVGKPVVRGQGVGNLSSVCVVHACGSLLCHGEEGWRRQAVALNKNVFIFKGEAEALSSICLLTETLQEIFHHLKAPRRGERGRNGERGAAERDSLSEL